MAETAGQIRDHLIYGLRNPLQEEIHAKFDNPINDLMALRQAARKAEGELNSYSGALGKVS